VPRLIELRLQNFRGFQDHRLPFRQTTVVVGQNNAGKSTIVEAPRLLAVATIATTRHPLRAALARSATIRQR
jgi:AAA15 family ATPase/GTPase